MGEIFGSKVKGRFQSRIMVFIGERDSYELGDKISVTKAIKRSGMPRDGYFLRSTDTGSAELLSKNVWTGLARQFFSSPCSHLLYKLWRAASC